jgi:predicted nucleic acid-binding protein
MTDHWVLNASPIIVLAKIGLESLLLSQADQVVVPRLVAKEIQVGPTEDPARLALANGLFSVVDTPPPSSELLAWDLGGGETAVLS